MYASVDKATEISGNTVFLYRTLGLYLKCHCLPKGLCFQLAIKAFHVHPRAEMDLTEINQAGCSTRSTGTQTE